MASDTNNCDGCWQRKSLRRYLPIWLWQFAGPLRHSWADLNGLSGAVRGNLVPHTHDSRSLKYVAGLQKTTACCMCPLVAMQRFRENRCYRFLHRYSHLNREANLDAAKNQMKGPAPCRAATVVLYQEHPLSTSPFEQHGIISNLVIIRI